MVINTHPNDKPLLMNRYMAVVYILFWLQPDQQRIEKGKKTVVTVSTRIYRVAASQK